MTKISTIYDSLVTLIQTELPTYTRLPNPYVVESNTYLHLNEGFGLAIGSGRDTERFVCELVTWERVYNIILVKRVVTTQNNTDVRASIEKGILDDHDKLRKKVFLESTLSGTVIKTTIVADNGVQFIETSQEDGGMKFLAMQMELVVEYMEDPNT